MVGRGEFILPDYRELELVLLKIAERELQIGFGVSLRIRPSTVETKSDVLHAEIWVEDGRTSYMIDCDLSP